MRDQNLTYYPENVSLADNGLKRNYLSANGAIMRYNACCFINFTGEQTDEIDGPLDNAESAKSSDGDPLPRSSINGCRLGKRMGRRMGRRGDRGKSS